MIPPAYHHLDALSFDIFYAVAVPGGVITYLSGAFEQITGWPVKDWIGQPFADLIHPADRSIASEVFRQNLTGVKLPPYIVRVCTRSGGYRSLETTAAYLADEGLLIGVARDVAGLKRLAPIATPKVLPGQSTARAADGQSPGYPQLLAAAQRQAQELALLDQVRTALTRELDLPRVFRTVVEAIAETFGYTQVSLYLIEGDRLLLQHQVGYHHELPSIPLTQGVMSRVARTGQPTLIRDVRSDSAFVEAMPGIVSEIGVPLTDQEHVVGVLNVESSNGFTLSEEDLSLMIALSDHISSAIGRARLYGEIHDREQQYRLVVETVKEVIFQTDATGIWTFLNPAWTEITGFAVAESVGRSLVEYVHAEDRARAALACARLTSGAAESCRVELRVLTRDGTSRWMDVQARGVPMGGQLGIAGTCTDITERKQAEEALRRQNEELAALHDTTLGLINQLDPDELLAAIVNRAAALVGSTDGYLYVREPGEDKMVMRVGTGVFAAQIGYDVKRGAGLAGRVWVSGSALAVQNYNHWDGHQPNLEALGMRAVVGIPLRSGQDVIGVIGLGYREEGRGFSAAEIALLSRFAQLAALALENARLYTAATRELLERRRAEATLAHLALHDPLTDLPNRSQLQRHLEQAIRSPGLTGTAFALLLMDLDRFKEVNDTLGHHMGDVLLNRVGQRLRTALRTTDTVARLGGDEFAVLLPGADRRTAERLARKLMRIVGEPFAIEGHVLDVGVSIGIAVCPEHGRDAETLLRRADVAMYSAKNHGAGYALYAAEQDPYSADRLTLLGDLRRAIDQDELLLYYQGKVSLKTGQPTGLEALVRWPHPHLGLLAPDQFIPLAEHTGLIKPLSQAVLNAALRQCRTWQQAGLGLPVAINLSMSDLRDPRLPEIIRRLLAAWTVQPARLRVEITEGTAMADPGRTMGVLTRLRDNGICLAIDDFGTGHSSLALLKRLPVDQIKIDKSFIRDMPKSESDIAIVRSTIDLGHSLGLSVVAEGVEDAETWDLLAALGCDEAQGYYLGRALPPAELTYWLRDRLRLAVPAEPGG